MASNLSISSFKIPRSVTCLALSLGTFIVLNWTLLKIAPFFDSNFVLMEGINDESWDAGGDILFLGDSRGHQGLIPREFEDRMARHGVEMDAMNLSRPGMQTPFTYYFSKRALKSAKKKPKVVVVNFSFYLLGGKEWMDNIYWAYYRPSLRESYHATIMRLMPWNEAAEWYIRTRIPAWMFRKRVNNVVKATLDDPRALRPELAGIYTQQELSAFEISKGYYSRGFNHISPAEIDPHSYSTGFERGYSVYFEYLNLMLEELAARDVHVYIYRFPWPEQRKNDSSFEEVLDHYWEKLKEGNESIASVHFLDEVYYWPIENFADPLHLNHPGAIKLTRILADKVAENSDKMIAERQLETKVSKTASLDKKPKPKLH